MYSRLMKVPDKSFFLFGPRGTGRTTWVRSSLPKAVYLDLLESELFNDLTANPQRLDGFLPAERKVVENYFSILEDLLIAAQVPVFAKKAKRRIAAHPKFFFFVIFANDGHALHLRFKMGDL